ncbi:MAG: F0F1 ATP synthase subunit epsilon [Gemmatimonadota bacterium]|nr:F0F1 ATP synthase subunit epsilon [Gemmatimonadota bacterium]
MASLNVRVVSPQKIVFEGEAAALVAPAWDGDVGILPGHAPMLALLGVGELAVDRPGGGSATFHVAGGVLKVERNTVTLLTEYAGDTAPEVVPASATVFVEDVED